MTAVRRIVFSIVFESSRFERCSFPAGAGAASDRTGWRALVKRDIESATTLEIT